MPELARGMERGWTGKPMAVLSLEGAQWDRDYTPWPAQGPKGRAFSGGAPAFLQTLVEEDSRVFADPAPLVAVGELKESSVTLVCKVWCKEEDYWPLYYRMQEAVKAAFDQAGISIPYAQLDVHVKQG